jgi:uncharacterized protein
MSLPIGESPIEILMKEHEMLLQYAGELKELTATLKKRKDADSAKEDIDAVLRLVEIFKESSSHYSREENVLFPWAEKKGISGPPRVMWMEHDQIRIIEKNLYKVIDERNSISFKEFTTQLAMVTHELEDMLTGHFFKENNMLFPATKEVIADDDWIEIKKQFNEIGYCSFSPKPAGTPIKKKEFDMSKAVKDGIVSFESGNLTIPQIEAIFNTLPVDVTFIDDENTVCFFSEGKDKLFARSRAIIGLKVQQCHPEKSVHLVNKIVADFKNGSSDVAEFWIPMGEKLVHIRYFAVRDKAGKYLGCMEVTQDIAPLKKIEGQKRL